MVSFSFGAPVLMRANIVHILISSSSPFVHSSRTACSYISFTPGRDLKGIPFLVADWLSFLDSGRVEFQVLSYLGSLAIFNSVSVQIVVWARRTSQKARLLLGFKNYERRHPAASTVVYRAGIRVMCRLGLCRPSYSILHCGAPGIRRARLSLRINRLSFVAWYITISFFDKLFAARPHRRAASIYLADFPSFIVLVGNFNESYAKRTFRGALTCIDIFLWGFRDDYPLFHSALLLLFSRSPFFILHRWLTVLSQFVPLLSSFGAPCLVLRLHVIPYPSRRLLYSMSCGTLGTSYVSILMTYFDGVRRTRVM